MSKLTNLVILFLVIGLLTMPAHAIIWNAYYQKDFLELGNPGGWTHSLKTFEEEGTNYVGQEIEIDIWASNLAGEIVTAGFYITYDPVAVSIISVLPYDGPGGPWDPVLSYSIPEPSGPGTYFVAVGQLQCVSPDSDGDIIIAKVRLRSETCGESPVTFSDLSSFESFITECECCVVIYDVLPNTVIIHQGYENDIDCDEVSDNEDNCPANPNPEQNDVDEDAIGDVCDNCPSVANSNQKDTDHDDLGDVCDPDDDNDSIEDFSDNCQHDPNPNQEDTSPPQGNGIGDACDCEGNFDCDEDVDGTDAATFKLDFGRSSFNRPCTGIDSCNGDFDCDHDCDGTNAALFKSDFGRSGFNNPCPDCDESVEWCNYSPQSECDIPANLLLAFAGGNGLAGNPLVICTGQQLSNVRTELDKNFIVKDDIDLTDMGNWEPIGDDTTPFTGVLDGNDMTISNLFIDRIAENYVGLLGVIGTGSVVKNVNLVDVEVSGGSWIGALAGRINGGNIEACASSGNIDGLGGHVGGLIGTADNSSKITISKSTCSINGAERIGGLIGDVFNSTTILNCYATGIAFCYKYAGGLVGLLYNSTLENSYSIGIPYGSEDIGGLVAVVSNPTVINSYWDVETSLNTWSAAGEGKTTAEMMQQATFVGWDFVNTWSIDEGVDYPRLHWETE